MTRDSDFKNLVRARMQATGQNYTAARADLLDAGEPRATNGGDPAAPHRRTTSDDDRAAWEQVRRDHERVVGRFLVDGRLVQVPMRRKTRAAVLLEFVALFEPGRDYAEREVNDMLRPLHDDVAFWRRELVDYGYLDREAGTYRLATTAPVRPAHLAQEFGDWERLWLPAFLAGDGRGGPTPGAR